MIRHVENQHKNQKVLVQCSLCQKKIVGSNIKAHMATHTDAVAAHCDICNKDFKQDYNYRVHCKDFAYEHACIENGNSEIGAWPATISFANLHFQNSAARLTSVLPATATDDARSCSAKICARPSRCKRPNTRRYMCSSRWRRQMRRSTAHSRRSSRPSSMSDGPKASLQDVKTMSEKNERYAG